MVERFGMAWSFAIAAAVSGVLQLDGIHLKLMLTYLHRLSCVSLSLVPQSRPLHRLRCMN